MAGTWRKSVLIMAAAFFAAAFATAGDEEQTIRAGCATKWPGDFRMQAYCVDLQREGLAAVAARDPSAEPMLTIRTHCSQRWPGDYRMQDYCETMQLEAYKKLQER